MCVWCMPEGMQAHIYGDTQRTWCQCLHLSFSVLQPRDRLSYWTRSWLLADQQSQAPRSWIARMQSHAWLFTWALRIWFQVSLIVRQELLSIEPFPRPCWCLKVYQAQWRKSRKGPGQKLGGIFLGFGITTYWNYLISGRRWCSRGTVIVTSSSDLLYLRKHRGTL